MVMTGCAKAPVNGKLDGMWKMTGMEIKHTGEIREPERIFFCIELHSIEVSDKGGNAGTFIGYMEKRGNEMMVERFVDGTGVLEDDERLKPFGMNRLKTDFNIEHVTDNRLVLSSDYARLSFKRF